MLDDVVELLCNSHCTAWVFACLCLFVLRGSLHSCTAMAWIKQLPDTEQTCPIPAVLQNNLICFHINEIMYLKCF